MLSQQSCIFLLITAYLQAEGRCGLGRKGSDQIRWRQELSPSLAACLLPPISPLLCDWVQPTPRPAPSPWPPTHPHFPGRVGAGGGQFDFNFIAEQLIHGSLSAGVDSRNDFLHQNEKWSDTTHYSSAACFHYLSSGRGRSPPAAFQPSWTVSDGPY